MWCGKRIRRRLEDKVVCISMEAYIVPQEPLIDLRAPGPSSRS